MNVSTSWIPWIIAAVVFSALLYIGSQNKKDPTWAEVKTLYASKIPSLSKSKTEVNKLYHDLHLQNADNEAGWKALSTPFLPTMTIDKFRSHLEDVLQEKSIVFNSNPGAGTSTVTSRLLNFISTDPAHTMQIICAPFFELKLHERHLESANGELFQFIHQAINHPDERYFLLIDNLDKINPESLWGPDMWNLLSERGSSAMVHGLETQIPDNFYMISVVHTGITAQHVLKDEHYRRIGKKRYVEVAPEELTLYLRDEREKYVQASTDTPSNLTDDDKMFHMVYAFAKSNEIITDQFGPDYQLGQWSDYRKQHEYTSVDDLLQIFVDHINSLKPDINYKLENLHTINYAIETNGLLEGSNWISKRLAWLEEKGYLTEFAVGLSFLLITGLISLFLVKRREKILTEYIRKLGDLITKYENNEIPIEALGVELTKVKRQVDQLALSKKINYNEANFFYSFFDDKIRRVEASKEIHAQFNDLLDIFLEDDYLSQSEHQKLRAFLDRIKSRISQRDYDYYDKVVKSLREKYSSSW